MMRPCSRAGSTPRPIQQLTGVAQNFQQLTLGRETVPRLCPLLPLSYLPTTPQAPSIIFNSQRLWL